jgi:hypothetical protein
MSAGQHLPSGGARNTPKSKELEIKIRLHGLIYGSTTMLERRDSMYWHI